jgi:hypothetical protein
VPGFGDQANKVGVAQTIPTVVMHELGTILTAFLVFAVFGK